LLKATTRFGAAARGPLSVGIIGGGIGGVAAGVALHKAGIGVTIYERTPVVGEVGAGMMLWPNATRVLRGLGLLGKLAAVSGASDHFIVRASSGKILMDIPLGQFDVPALCARRADLLDVLTSGLPPGKILLNHHFECFERRKHGVSVHFDGGVSAEHDVVIGADGIRSRVRSQLLGPHEPIYRGYTVWRGLAHLPGAVPSRCNSETWGRGKRFGILNTGRDRFTWYATANTPEDHIDSLDGPQHELLRLFSGWHEPVERLIAATPEATILKKGAYDLEPLQRWGAGRIMLLGDAAHPCTPNLGQGGCMAIEDALVLAKCLQNESSPEIALRHYESKRRKRTRHVQQRSLLMGHIGQWENRLVIGGREVVTSILPAKIFERNLRRVYSYAA
jgi:2-polyprenyl-6-methoxyphenol hydroxylase-like FAD-dependent oxidoreductase